MRALVGNFMLVRQAAVVPVEQPASRKARDDVARTHGQRYQRNGDVGEVIQRLEITG